MADNEVQAFIQAVIRSGQTDFGYVKSFPVLKMTKDGTRFRMGMGYHGRAAHEYVVLAEKGRRRFPKELEKLPDVLSFPWTGDGETRKFTPNGKPYPTAKPIALYEYLLKMSTDEGERILDPFSGSGTLAVAASGS